MNQSINLWTCCCCSECIVFGLFAGSSLASAYNIVILISFKICILSNTHVTSVIQKLSVGAHTITWNAA
jgi:hypothetical protein